MLPYPGMKKSHRDLFGEMAIAIKPEDGKTLGMHPCAYYHDDVALSELSNSFASDQNIEKNAIHAQLTQITDLLKILSIIESLSRVMQTPSAAERILPFEELPQEVFTIDNLTKDEGEELIKALTQLDAKNAEFIIDLTNFHREPMYDLYGK